MNSKPDDWKDELYQAYVARWQAREAEESESRRQAGKIAIWLERAPDDAETFASEHQTELRTVVGVLHHQGIGIEAPFMTLDAADAVGGYVCANTLRISWRSWDCLLPCRCSNR